MEKKIHEDPKWEQYISPECEHFDHRVLRPTHGCQVNKETTIVYCGFQNLRIDASLISIGAHGGEPLESVMGQDESMEFPTYQKGAFSTPVKPKFEVSADYRTNLHYMEDLLNNMKYPTKKNKGQIETSCAETWKGTTLLITRYEYVNLYHTMTDWWNAFWVLPGHEGVAPQALPPLASEAGTRVLLLDGHAQGNLDSAWAQLFGPTTYVSDVPKGGLCLESAIVIPPGYHATLFPESNPIPRRQCPLHKQGEAFANYVLASYGLPQGPSSQHGKVVIVDRQPYISHPRSKLDNFARTLTNLGDVQTRVQQVEGVTSAELVRLELLPFEEQVRTFQQAQIVIGMHGAGLTNILFMDSGTFLIEYTEGYQQFFSYLAEWKDVEYQVIETEGNVEEMAIQQTVDLVSRIVKGEKIPKFY